MRRIAAAAVCVPILAPTLSAAIVYSTTDQRLIADATRTFQGQTLSPSDSFTAPALTPVNQTISARAPATGAPFTLGRASLVTTFSPTMISARGEILTQSEAVGFPGAMNGSGFASVLFSVGFTTTQAATYEFTFGGLFTTEGQGFATLYPVMISGDATIFRNLPRQPIWIENTETLSLPAGAYTLSALVDGSSHLHPQDFGGSSAGFFASLRLVPAPGTTMVALLAMAAWTNRRRNA